MSGNSLSSGTGSFLSGDPNSDNSSTVFQQVFISIIALSALFLALCLVRWFLLRTTARRMISSLVNRNTAGGLDSAAIAALPTFPYQKYGASKNDNEDNNNNGTSLMECSICLSAVEEGETVKLLPECLHSFHGDCVDMWLSGHTTCPVCRIEVLGSTSAVHQLSQDGTVAVPVPVPVADLEGRP
ncbi:RING-H2 finger protein ATL1-like [Carex rostrata]